MTTANIIMIAFVPLIMYRIYKRVQRLTVRQKSRSWRHWCAVVLWPVLLGILGVSVMAKPVALAAMAGGCAVGIALAFVALRRTGFERVGDEYFYTPYAPIGLVISMLFIARMLYRLFEVFTYGPQQTPDFGSNPLTLTILGVVASYYVVYGVGLLRWRNAERVKAGAA
ncbi:MAG: hypothetical protein ACJ8GW_07325 [Massilia sp.]